MIERAPSMFANPRVRVALVLCLLFGALVWPVVFAGGGGTNEAYDQNTYHLPVIHAMAEQWPRVDLTNYQSATTPGYHLVLVLVAKMISSSTAVLQFASSLFSLALILVVWHWVADKVGPWRALALVSPLLFSQSFLGGAIWLTTDNPALLFVVLAIGICLRSALRPMRAALGSVWATLAVLVRQLHLWLAAPLALAVMLRSPVGCGAPAILRVDEQGRWSWKRTIGPLLMLACPFVVVIVFVRLWGGLTPPGFADQHASGPNLATPAVILGLIGALGVFFWPYFLSVGDHRRAMMYCLIGAVAAMVIASIAPTTYDREAGRWGGAIWELARRLPTVADRSIALTILSGLGGFMLVRIWRTCMAAGRGREAGIIMFALLAWSAAQSMNAQAWQRYCEPIILILIAYLAAMVSSAKNENDGASAVGRAWIGPVILAIAQSGITATQLYRDVLV